MSSTLARTAAPRRQVVHALRVRTAANRAASTASASTPTQRLALSVVEGPHEPPLATKTLPAYFAEDILPMHAGRPALICRRERPHAHGGPRAPDSNLGVDTHLAWSFGELDEHVRALARGLVALGVRKGDRVGVIMGNNRCVAGSMRFRPGRGSPNPLIV